MRDYGVATREKQRARGSERRAAVAEAAQERGVPAGVSSRDTEQENCHPAGGVWAVRGESVCLRPFSIGFPNDLTLTLNRLVHLNTPVIKSKRNIDNVIGISVDLNLNISHYT